MVAVIKKLLLNIVLEKMMLHNIDVMEQMKNPLSPVKMVRETYSRYLQKNFTEVQVQFKDEEPAWIPYETLLAMQKNK